MIAASLPLNNVGIQTVNSLKQAIINAAKAPIDERLPFCVETDASDEAISGILNDKKGGLLLFFKDLTSF